MEKPAFLTPFYTVKNRRFCLSKIQLRIQNGSGHMLSHPGKKLFKKNGPGTWPGQHPSIVSHLLHRHLAQKFPNMKLQLFIFMISVFYFNEWKMIPTPKKWNIWRQENILSVKSRFMKKRLVVKKAESRKLDFLHETVKKNGHSGRKLYANGPPNYKEFDFWRPRGVEHPFWGVLERF